MTLGKWLMLFEPQFPHLQNGSHLLLKVGVWIKTRLPFIEGLLCASQY